VIRTLVQWTVRTWNFRWGGTVGDTRFSQGVTCAAQSVSQGRTKIIFVHSTCTIVAAQQDFF
jgi:hypothetical protein